MTYEELFKRISPKLKAIAYKASLGCVFGSDDLFQEAGLHLWEDFCKGALNDKTDSYILQGCYFHLKNYLRKNRKKTVFTHIDSLLSEEEGSCSKDYFYLEDKKAGNFFDELNDKMLASVVLNNGLTDREKNVLLLFMEGLTTRAIGSRLGVSHVRVVKLMQAIRGKCKKYLD
ncbi:MAG: sigma-70 family RNA polymerase sigma factor [Candidatus Omnitrophota bacterium]